MGAPDLFGPFLTAVLLLLACLAISFWALSRLRRSRPRPRLSRFAQNPVLAPDPSRWWESEAVFNPGAVVHDGRVHLFYRALGRDGVSRIGYAWSQDGIHFERWPTPVFEQRPNFSAPGKLSYRTLTYNTDSYASGGGWGGTEDPRAVLMDGMLYLTFGVFEGWQSMRLGLSTLPIGDFDARRFTWAPYLPLSPRGETHKNWVLFPEKIHGKFAILHALTPQVMIEYLDRLEDVRDRPIQSNNHRSGRKGHWDALIRGAGAPPIRTPYGWLLLYHGMDPARGTGYQVGAMLLDLNDPTKILYQSDAPILSPAQWYENDWKPGVVYATGAVVLDGELIVYYGGGDKYVAAAKAPLRRFLHRLMSGESAVLEPATL